MTEALNHKDQKAPLSQSALEGIRILDFTRYQQGPFATVLLSDMGAEIIKVEEPGGEPGRATGLQKDGFSAYFEAHNRGKKSITLDLHHCIGAMLARAEMETAFRCFFSRIKNVELEKPLAEVPHHPSIWLRQLKELPITFTKI